MNKKLLSTKNNEDKRQKSSNEKVAVDDSARTMIRALVIILAIVVAAVCIMVLVNARGNGHDEKWGSAHFYDTANYPELSTEGIKGAITEAYYTKNGALCVKLRFSNGIDAEHFVTSLEVKVSNEDDEVIATGYTADIPGQYSVPAKDYNTFTFYISKKFVKIPDDDLDKLTYEITVQGEVDSDALTSATATAGSGATTTGGSTTTTAAQ